MKVENVDGNGTDGRPEGGGEGRKERKGKERTGIRVGGTVGDPRFRDEVL